MNLVEIVLVDNQEFYELLLMDELIDDEADESICVCLLIYPGP